MAPPDDKLDAAQRVIARAQRIHVSAHQRLCHHGVQPIDTLIAGTYAAHQLATALHGSPIAAIEWLRDAIDTIERQVLEAVH